jgi:glyoxylase-like metal-dependent hydrolase (beta-lactamase superfamily II)
MVEPLALYPASTPQAWQKHATLLNEQGKFITTVGAYLIEAGDQIIAVDLGIGPVCVEFPGLGPFFGGQYLDNFKKTGIRPDQVTDMLFTHMHVDHVGWTTLAVAGRRELIFPNARYWVTAAEWEFWRSGDHPGGPHPEFVQKPLEGRIEPIAPGDTFASNITILSTPGHTPGHISLLIDGDNERLYLLGDVLHGAMQVEEPEWSVVLDHDPALARQSRERLYPELVKPNTIAAANHFSNAVFGRIVEVNGQRRWSAL